MPRNKQALTQELKRIFKEAEEAALRKSFDPSIVSSSDDMASVISKVAIATASTFSESLAGPLATAIHNYMNDQEFDVSGLSNGGGTVAGILKVKP